MKKLNREEKLEGLIHSTMEKVGMDLELRKVTTGVNMSYDFIKNYIGIDVTRVQTALKEMPLEVSLEVYIQSLTLHELGHAMDRKALLESLPRTIEFYVMKKANSLYEQYSQINLWAMRIEEHEMNIIFEETAWTNAEWLNKQFSLVDWKSFEQIKIHSLSTYHELYERDLKLYHKLLSLPIEQTAS